LATLAAALAGHKLIALDTSVWIYHLEGSAAYGQAADRVLETVAQGRIEGVASELVLLELLVAPLKKGAQDVADEIELALLHFPHLQLAPVTRPVLVRAAEIRARYGLRTPDAIMIATAVESGATLAVTNDDAWQKVEEIEIVLVRDLKSTTK
jgi:predicted nucleic acid-binding protein